MIQQNKVYLQEYSYFEEILLISLGSLFLAALFFLLVTYMKRWKKINEEKQKEEIKKSIEPVLFSYLFNDTVPPVFNNQNLLFQKIVIKQIKNLHQNYSGIYQTKLETLYVSGGFVNYSLQKLDSDNWTSKVEAIRDLSTLNYKKALPKIQALMYSDNELVQMEALIGIIRLSSLEKLETYKNTSLFLNDWVQSNLLYAIKKYHLKMPDNLEALLESKNDTFLLFAVRLMDYFQFTYGEKHLIEILQKTKSEKLKIEIKNHLKINLQKEIR